MGKTVHVHADLAAMSHASLLALHMYGAEYGVRHIARCSLLVVEIDGETPRLGWSRS